jgi:long-chain fatty acid transport protein
MAGASAGAHGLEALFFNPAAAGLVDAPSASLGATLIAPDSEISGADGSFGAFPNGGASSLDDVMPDTAIPAFYAATPLDLSEGERLAVGLALNAPFGLETDYGRTWQGRYYADTTRVVTVNVNPMLAYRVTDTLTFGAGVQAQYYSGELSSAINFGQFVPPAFGGPAPPTPATDGHVIIEADDWGIGFNLGALWTPFPGTRVGVGYRSEIEHTLHGRANFQGDAAGIAAGAAPLFTDTGARAKLETPRQLSVGVSQAVGARLTVLGEAQWIDWSTFDSLVVKFDTPNQPDDVTVTDWDDGWFVALGARYALTDRWRISAGAAYDGSPVPDATLEPRIPDADRAWLALGADWTPTPGVTLKLGYAHLFMPSRTIDLDAGDRGNAGRGDLAATTDTDVDILSVQLRLRF